MSKFLDRASEFLAHRKGLLPIIGLVLILINLLIQLIFPGSFLATTNLFLHLGCRPSRCHGRWRNEFSFRIHHVKFSQILFLFTRREPRRHRLFDNIICRNFNAICLNLFVITRYKGLAHWKVWNGRWKDPSIKNCFAAVANLFCHYLQISNTPGGRRLGLGCRHGQFSKLY